MTVEEALLRAATHKKRILIINNDAAGQYPRDQLLFRAIGEVSLALRDIELRMELNAIDKEDKPT